MKFKDILNQGIVDLKNCEDELIHIPGSIQPFGFFLGLKTSDLMIDFCSGNSFQVTGLKHEQRLGKSIELVLGQDQTTRLKNHIASLDEVINAPIRLQIVHNTFNCIVQKNSNAYMLEFEPELEEQLKASDIYQQTKQVATYIQKADTLKMLCQYVADETRAITGYDRVMIYKFDEDNNGEVYAESKVENLESWLNLHYPHTDIPIQARTLYMKNLVRIIADVDYVPVPIYTIDDGIEKNLDLSLSILRSSSPIHIQYLKNMGVAATLTISLVYQNKLWGLIACHNMAPKLISNDVRIAAQLQGHFLISQIGVRELAEEYEVAKKVNKALDDLLSGILSTDSISIDQLISEQNLLAITNASGVIILLDDVLYTSGKTPSANEIRKLTNWLQTYSPPVGISLSNLSAVYPDAKKWSNLVSGIIFHSLESGRDNCIMWCRPEVIQEVYWAGDPNEAVIKSETTLSPRNSFKAWKELKRHESSKWQKPELTAAANFVNVLQKHVHMLFLAKEELKQRTLNERLKEANAELENMYWIGSHDLKEPLRKIQMFASRIISKDDVADLGLIFSSVSRMNDSAKRMQLLISDVLSYSRLNFVKDGFETINFNNLVKNVVEELAVELQDYNATIEYDTLPEIKGLYLLLQQLLNNLIRNSLKFSKEQTAPHIIISYQGITEFTPPGESYQKFHKINIADNGIGFDNQFKESIFNVFNRLHARDKYAGSGVGLALCRKIMKNHNGHITAEGSPGVGTAISLFFPTYKVLKTL